MARIRTIKPTFFTDPDVAALPLTARLTFIGLWTHVDDAGRAVDDPRLVKAALWPLDDGQTAKKVDIDLCLLAERGRIERYEAEGRHYLRIRNWGHQRINRPQPSTLPASPSEKGSSRKDHGAITDDSLNDHGGRTEPSLPEGKGRDWKGKESSVSSLSDSRPPPPPAAETEDANPRTSTAQVELLTGRMVGFLLKPTPRSCDECRPVAAWTLAHVDFRLADEFVGYIGTLNGKPRSAAYFAAAIRDLASQRGVDMPEYRPAGNS